MPPVRLGEREGPAPRKKRAERKGLAFLHQEKSHRPAQAPDALPTLAARQTPRQEPLITPRGRRRAPVPNTPATLVRLGEREGPAPRKKRAEREPRPLARRKNTE